MTYWNKDLTKETDERVKQGCEKTHQINLFNKFYQKLGKINSIKRKEYYEKYPEKKEEARRKTIEFFKNPYARMMVSVRSQGIDAKDWKGFITSNPYPKEFNNKFRESIRKRDDRCCIICNETEEILHERLSVHHIDYDKKNSTFQNCISLCRKHHLGTNHNRKYWKNFFQTLLSNRYNYKYVKEESVSSKLGDKNV